MELNDRGQAAAGLAPVLLLVACFGAYLPGILALPPIDRDEARYARATKEMLETGDFIRPRFAGDPRDKKPIGIYWLQAAAVTALGTRASISAYRVPSLLGALLAIFLTYRLGCALFEPRVARLGAAFLGSSLAMAAEATMATTDAVLLATVVVCEHALARVWMSRGSGGPLPARIPLVFWAALAIGTLVKGPVTPAVVALTAAALSVHRGGMKGRWLLRLRPLLGIGVVAAVVLPWAIAVGRSSGGDFYRRAFLEDIAPKLISGHEGHGAPPGYHLLIAAVAFFPGSLSGLPSVVAAFHRRHEDALRFSLAWLLPVWLLFEAVPTKLPHYMLPAYPALALLSAWGVTTSGEISGRLAQLVTWAWVAVAALITSALVAAVIFSSGIHATAGAAAASVTAGMAGLTLLARRRCPERAAWTSIAGTAVVIPIMLGVVLPGLDPLWLGRQAATVLATAGPDRPAVTVGYLEPSLVFFAPGSIHSAEVLEAARFLADHPTGVALVSEDRQEPFDAAVASLSLALRSRIAAEGWNYSKGRRMRLWLYERAPAVANPPSS